MRTIPPSEQREMPWRNGGGSTLEVFVQPAQGRFAWRVSVAQVKEDGPFSLFDNYERHIMVLNGAGMDLHFNGGEMATLPPLQPYTFAGDVPAQARLHNGAVADFNLMVDRAYGRGRLTVMPAGRADRFECTADHCLVYCLTGPSSGHATLLDKGEVCDLAADMSAAICEIWR